jgi:hypothetical protein
VPRVVGLVVLAVLVIGVAIALSFALGPTRLDPQAAQRDVAAQYEQRDHQAIDLSCPDKMDVEAGKTYTCDGTTADGQQLTITLTITNADGDYTWSDR